MKIYLAGAIDKVSPEFATGWRKYAAGQLTGCEILDPTGKIGGTYKPAEVVEPDLAMIKQADIVLAEISRDDIPYHGTSMEIAYAYFWNKTIYVWGGCKSYWVRYHADEVFDTLDEALNRLTGKTAYMPGGF